MSGTVFLDLCKAFDLVNHDILITKLTHYLGFSTNIPFFHSYLTARSQSVYVDGQYSCVGAITHGVPQGSVLGPVLFCLYINDLPLHIKNPSIECHMLADDTTLLSNGKNIKDIETSLQSGLNDTLEWCSTNRMVLNHGKTKTMALSTRQKNQTTDTTIHLKIKDSPVEQVSEHRVLGVIVDNNLQWQTHITHLSKRLSRNVYLLSQLQHFITDQAKILFFNAHIKSHIDYASVIWDGSSKNQIRKINSIHRRAIKLLRSHTSYSSVSETMK